MRLDLTCLESPLGSIVLETSGAGVHRLDFAKPAAAASGGSGREIAARVVRYFDGDLAAFDGVRVAAAGTDFQHRVWAALRRIPPGETTSYGRLAEALGCPGAARAVGRANATNPVAIVVPCHRVIGADGTLTGYAGGVERKRWLLHHERAAVAAIG